MAASQANPHQFGPDVGPESLTLLDNNYNPLFAAINTLANFDNEYVDSGAANAMVVTVSAPQLIPAYVDGLMLQVRVAATNTSTAVTIAVNALGAKAVVMPDGSLPDIGAFPAGSLLQLQYQALAGNFQVVGGNPVTNGTFTATITGFTGATTANCTWAKYRNLVLLNVGSFSGTSNATSMTWSTALPAAINPGAVNGLASQIGFVNVTDNGASTWGSLRIHSGGINPDYYKNGNPNGWTAAGTKGTDWHTIAYILFQP